MKRISFAVRGLALACAAGLGLAATQAPVNTVTKTEAGHRLGSAEAKTKLIEFVSYTCPHCATFEKEAEGALKLVYVRSGRTSVEIRHIVRDPIDLTAALLANCGDKSKFFQNHTALMLAHPEWMAKARATTQAQQVRWTSGDYAARRRAIAADLDFYKLMEGRGYKRTEVDACLNDDAKARALVTQTNATSAAFGVRGTPSFALNGKLLDGVHNWSSLQPVLQNATKTSD